MQAKPYVSLKIQIKFSYMKNKQYFYQNNSKDIKQIWLQFDLLINIEAPVGKTSVNLWSGALPTDPSVASIQTGLTVMFFSLK